MRDHCDKCLGTGMVMVNEFGWDYYLPQPVPMKPCPKCRGYTGPTPDTIDRQPEESKVLDMKETTNHIYSVEITFMPAERHGGIGSDTRQTFFATRRDAEFESAVNLSAPPNTAPLHSKEILSVKIRKHFVNLPNSPKQAWLSGRRSGQNESSIEDIGWQRAELSSVWTKDDGWLIKDDRSSARRPDAADHTQPF